MLNNDRVSGCFAGLDRRPCGPGCVCLAAQTCLQVTSSQVCRVIAAASAVIVCSSAFLGPPGEAVETLGLAIARNAAKLDHEGSLAVNPAVAAVLGVGSAVSHVQVPGQSHGFAICVSGQTVSSDHPCSTATTVPGQAQMRGIVTIRLAFRVSLSDLWLGTLLLYKK